MAFLLNGKPLAVDRSFRDADGNTYPSNFLRIATEEQKAAIGITWEPDPEPVDTRFYWDHNLPKDIDDLKTQWIKQQKEIAASLFAPTDWYIIRKVDTGIDVPNAIKLYRDEIRLASDGREDQISQVTTVEELITLVNDNLVPWPTNPLTP
jgi:hypothetical protein